MDRGSKDAQTTLYEPSDFFSRSPRKLQNIVCGAWAQTKFLLVFTCFKGENKRTTDGLLIDMLRFLNGMDKWRPCVREHDSGTLKQVKSNRSSQFY